MSTRTRLVAGIAAGAVSVGLTIGAPLASSASTVVTAADPVTSQETDTAVSFNGWIGVDDASASGGTYRYNTTAKSVVSFVITGTELTLLTRKGPDQGNARVLIDGVLVGKLDLYAPTVSNFAASFTGLTPSGGHKVILKVMGTKNAASTGTSVVFDGFIDGTSTTQDSYVVIRYNTWQGGLTEKASGSAYRVERIAGASASFRFTGSSVDWITSTGRDKGKAQVSIDGIDRGVVDLYGSSGSPIWQVPVSYTGLCAGAHTITITVLGTKNGASKNSFVVIDAFIAHS